MNCPHCGISKFGTSRMRLADIPRLALFQLPVRCLVCQERFHAGVSLALHVRQVQLVDSRERTHQRHANFLARTKANQLI